MSTLLLRLAGPMQSWGTQSRFLERDTGREPSKSGVVGLLCAALGRPRSEPVDDLAALPMGVRVDFAGRVASDFQTAGGTHLKGDRYGVLRASGARSTEAVVSRRHYLADADFLVGLEGDDAVLHGLQQALAAPHWQLCLGRKAFVPGVPVQIPDGLKTGIALDAALEAEPWPRLGLPLPPSAPAQLIVIRDAVAGPGTQVRFDLPIGAAFLHRRFAPRHVTTEPIPIEKIPRRLRED